MILAWVYSHIILRFLEMSVGICKGPKYMAKQSWYYQVNTYYIDITTVFMKQPMFSPVPFDYYLISLSLKLFQKNGNHQQPPTTKHHELRAS